MAKSHSYVLERNLFSAGIYPDGHGGTGAERDQQIIVGAGTFIVAAVVYWLVTTKVMATGHDFLRKPAGLSVYNHIGCCGLGSRTGGRNGCLHKKRLRE